MAGALVTATSAAAEAVGLGRHKGRLAAGFDADLLVVSGDLEHDAGALLRPVTVHLRGRPVRG